MGRINVYLEKEEDDKLDRLKKKFNKNSKEDVIKSLIKQFPESKEDDFNFNKETSISDLI